MKERPEVKIYATDKSINALLVAKKNSELNKTNKIIFLNHDWKKQWLFPSADLIISNPPYVDKAELDEEEDGVWFEPEEALFSDKSGFSDIEIILQKSFGFLKKKGKTFNRTCSISIRKSCRHLDDNWIYRNKTKKRLE